MKKEIYTLQEYADLYLKMLYEQDWIICDNFNLFVPYKFLLCDYSIDVSVVHVDICISFRRGSDIVHFDLINQVFSLSLFSEPFKFERFLSDVFLHKQKYKVCKHVKDFLITKYFEYDE